MLPFSINWREVAFGGIAFVLVMIGFGLLGALINWPNEREGWPLAVALAAVVAFLPLIARTVSFLQRSGASVEGPFGFKLNFRAAAEAATVKTAIRLTDNLVQPGVPIHATSSKELNEVAAQVTEQSVVVINFEDGHAWYKTRLFALAATAEILHAPRALVLVGVRGGQPMQVAGWVRPRDLVKAVIRSDSRYGEVWQHAQGYFYLLQSRAMGRDQEFPVLPVYRKTFEEIGPASILMILITQMQAPDPPLGATPPTARLEDPDSPPWITLADAESMLDPWLIRSTLDLGKPEGEQVTAMMAATGDIVVVTRAGQYAGLIDVVRAERELLRQLLERPTSDQARAGT